MLNVNLGDYAPEGSAVRIIDQMVDTLDTTEIESAYQVHSEAGRPPFTPRLF
jgi:transposase